MEGIYLNVQQLGYSDYGQFRRIYDRYCNSDLMGRDRVGVSLFRDLAAGHYTGTKITTFLMVFLI
jgi:hypothetical protein